MVNSYVSFDIETTGFNHLEDEIIEIGAIKVENGEIVDKFETLICPEKLIDFTITELTGISNAMVLDAPTISEKIISFLDFVDNYVVLGHNVKFDIRFIKAACSKVKKDFNNTYIDTLDLSRDYLPQLSHHRLQDMCEVFGIDNINSHRALSDCIATHELYQGLMQLDKNAHIAVECSAPVKKKKYKPAYTEKTQSLQLLQGLLLGITCDNILTESEVFALKAWLDNNQHLCGEYPFDRAAKAIDKALEDGVLEQHELDEMLEIFKALAAPDFKANSVINDQNDILNEKIYVLTGDFERASRAEVTEFLESKGAKVKTAVSGKTDYLIVGGLGSLDWKCGNYGSKIKKALELKDAGKNIQIINEVDFWELIGE